GRRTRTGFVIVAIVFAVLYGYDVIEGITDLVLTPMQIASANVQLESLGLEPTPIPWVPLIANAVLPVVGYVAALLIALRRRPLHAALAFACGWAAVAALTLSMYVFGMVITA